MPLEEGSVSACPFSDDVLPVNVVFPASAAELLEPQPEARSPAVNVRMSRNRIIIFLCDDGIANTPFLSLVVSFCDSILAQTQIEKEYKIKEILSFLRAF